MENDITKMTLIELQALLWRIDQQSQQLQQQYQQVGLELQKRVEEKKIKK
jgi:hypothetical protein